MSILRFDHTEIDAPLTISWIKSDLKHTEPLDGPEKEPRLACILTRVTLRKALDKISNEKLEMFVLVKY
jgi:hypothetical protein